MASAFAFIRTGFSQLPGAGREAFSGVCRCPDHRFTPATHTVWIVCADLGYHISINIRDSALKCSSSLDHDNEDENEDENGH